jgi:hypothetical protein
MSFLQTSASDPSVMLKLKLEKLVAEVCTGWVLPIG